LSQDHPFIIVDKDLVNCEGFVVSEITGSEKTNSFVFRSLQGEKIIIRTDKYSSFDFGDKISVSGKAIVPENFQSENGIIFDYQKYLLIDGITHIVAYPQIKLIEKNSKQDLYYYIFSFKKFFVKKTQSIFSKETSSLGLCVLIGSRDSIDRNLENNFRRTGLIHILVLSGFNLTIIIYFVFQILKNIHRTFRFIFSLLFVLFFIIMVGAGATVVRSGIMIFLFVSSKILRRNSDAFNAVILAGSIMIFQNPMILLYNPSFQLSFAATVGLISFSKYIDNIMVFSPNRFSVKEIII
jgi:competence protein ComEC